MLVGSIAIFSLVATLLIVAWRRPESTSATNGGNERTWILGLGIAFPAAVLIVLLGFGLWIGEQLLPRQGPLVVEVQGEARQWAWTFSYANAPGRTTENVLHIPAGRPVDVAITTRDVIHSFWVPRLAGKLDAIPGHVNVLRIEADRPGVYAGQSSEFSGPGYDGHAFEVVVHSTEDWQIFLSGKE